MTFYCFELTQLSFKILMQVRGLIYYDWLWFTLHITLIYSVVPTVATSGDGLSLFRIKVWTYIWKLQSFAISKSPKPSLLLKVKMFCLFQISVPFVSDPTRISRGILSFSYSTLPLSPFCEGFLLKVEFSRTTSGESLFSPQRTSPCGR